MSPPLRPRKNLVEGPIPSTLLGLAWPMLIGISAILLFNIVDTFWVGQLGAHELAAMSFTFPVVFLVMSVSMGMSIGTTAVISKAIGQGHRAGVRRLTTDALALSVVIVSVMGLTGLALLEPIFQALGANDSLMPLIRQYMVPWFLGVGFVVIPMVGNGAIRATGDTRTPSLVMLAAGGTNLLLDPLLIFGIGPFPRMELQGAALATVLSYMVAFGAALWMLGRRERMLDARIPAVREVLASWRAILHLGIPAAATNLLLPLSTGVLTRMVASHGTHAVAGFGVATRLEGLSMIGVSSLAAALTPFVGQNFGASRWQRVAGGVRFSMRAAVMWGGGVALALGLAAPYLARLFNDDPDVIRTATTYLRVVPWSYAGLGIALLAGSTFQALQRPFRAAQLVVLRLAVLAVPLAWVGSKWLGVPGLFGGVAAANLLVGCFAWWEVKRQVPSSEGMDAGVVARPSPAGRA
jgi:MATE family, multidrug efflux pump